MSSQLYVRDHKRKTKKNHQKKRITQNLIWEFQESMRFKIEKKNTMKYIVQYPKYQHSLVVGYDIKIYPAQSDHGAQKI